MFNKNLAQDAHRMSREIKKEFPEIDYNFQFGINIKYLLSEVREVEEIMEDVKFNKVYAAAELIRKGIKEISDPAKPEVKERRLKMLQDNISLFKEEEFSKCITLRDGFEKAMEIAYFAGEDEIAPKKFYNMLHLIDDALSAKEMESILIEDKKNLVKIEMPLWLASKKEVESTLITKIEKETEKAVCVENGIWLPKSQIEIVKDF